MKPTILLYNINNKMMANKIKFTAIQMGIQIKTIAPSHYAVPLSTLCFGSATEQEPYLIDEPAAFSDQMLVMAGFLNGQLNTFLNQLTKQKVPRIALKAILTEQNAQWDSRKLHDELKEEDAAMHAK